MNNYANWEITQLLSHKADSNITTCYWYKRYSLVCFDEKSLDELVILPFEPLKNNSIVRTSITGELLSAEKAKEYVHYKNRYTGKVAWSWEDIRLYLESKGFSININHYVLQDIPYWCHVVNSIDRNSQDIGKFDTYEQAREGAIKWCLNKLNKN